MKSRSHLFIALVALFTLLAESIVFADSPIVDLRNIRTGSAIPDESYCDQPYVVKTADGNWLCTLTTGSGVEGDDQHVVSTISTDKGQTWSPLVDIEPLSGPKASWVIPFIADSGRVYAFYVYNDTGLTGSGSQFFGSYMFKYSDDNGQTWSDDRYKIPMPLTNVDRTNTFNGTVQLFWGVDNPVTLDNEMYFAFSKFQNTAVGGIEGFVVHSDNIMTEEDPTKIHWEILPDGDTGITSSAIGRVQEEHNLVAMNDGSLYCMYRTETGSPAHAYSLDKGHTWSEPVKATYTPYGRVIKNPRANAHIWKTDNGRYLLWYSNEGPSATNLFLPRNPNWLSGGIEIDGKIHWSQPELVLYDPSQSTFFSYPDLIQEGDNYWITETNKSVARVHSIDSNLINGLWTQGQIKSVAQEGLALDYNRNAVIQSSTTMPLLPNLTLGGGFSIDFWLTTDSLDAGQIIADARDANGKGMLISTTSNGAVEIKLADGTRTSSWTSDPGLIKRDTLQHVVATVDGGPKIISFIVDGVFNDGGSARSSGYSWFDANLGNVNGNTSVALASSLQGNLNSLRIYERPLRTSEAVGNYNAVEQPEVRTLVFDGSYDPYGLTVPADQNKWYHDGGLLSPTIIEQNGDTYALLSDNSTDRNQRIQISHDLKDLRALPWTCETRLNILAANACSYGQFAWGVRDEGGDGKCVLLNWFDDGLYLTDNSVVKNENAILVNDNDFRGDGSHLYRIEKFLADGKYAVQVYIDNIAQFATPLDYNTLPDDATTHTGFGYFGASAGTSTVLMDFMEFGPLATAQKIAGDANGDGKVDGSDVTILAGNWQAGVGNPAPGTITWEMGDFNGDGQVDGSDVTILAGNWQYGVTAAAASVPEPSILALLVGGAACFVWRIPVLTQRLILAALLVLTSSGSGTLYAETPIASHLQPLVDRHELAGAVMLVADKDKILAHETVGFADVATKKTMQKDSLFWIASQTKPMTATALMMLVDEGKVNLDDPVEKYLPEFRGQMVIAEKDDDHMLLKKPKHPITVRNILSHTSGLPFHSDIEVPTLDRFPLADRVRSYAMIPLQYEPDTQYRYSNAGLNTAARIIEVITEMKYEKFLYERLFKPLGMNDTTFWPSEEQVARIATSYKSGPNREGLEATTVTQLHYPLTDRINRYPMPAGGLFSSATDIAKFYRMILNEGELDGHRYLSKEAVKTMTSRQTTKGDYGLGFSVQSGKVGHAGAYSSNSYIDTKSGLILIWLVQHANFPGDGGACQEIFQRTALEKFSKGQ